MRIKLVKKDYGIAFALQFIDKNFENKTQNIYRG
jgi:hypothetical protein